MSPILLASILLIGLTASLVVFIGLSTLDEKDRFKQTMKRAQGEVTHDQREENLSKSFIERALQPVAGSLIPFLYNKTPKGYIDNVRKKMIRLGKPDNEAVDKFLAIRLLSLVLVPLLAVFFTVTQFGVSILGAFAVPAWIIIILLVIFFPDIALSRKVDRRQAQIQDQLPDILDLLTISVEAGLGFEQAVDRVVANVPGPFSEEMNRMLGESRSGMSRAESLRALDMRVGLPDVKSFVMAILQADKFGVSIGRVLRMQSDDMRIKRRQIAQEKAQKAPVKILMPTVLFIFPVLFIVVLGPAVIRIFSSF